MDFGGLENDSKKHAKKGNVTKIKSARERLEMPPWVPLRIKNQNQIQIQAQVHRTIKDLRDTPLRAAHGGGFLKDSTFKETQIQTETSSMVAW